MENMLRWEGIRGLARKCQHFVSCFVNREIGCIYYFTVAFFTRIKLSFGARK